MHLNAMAGASPASMGINTDGRYLLGNRWFDNNGSIIKSGNTVGFLVCLSSTSNLDTNSFINNESKNCTNDDFNISVGGRSRGTSSAETPERGFDDLGNNFVYSNNKLRRSSSECQSSTQEDATGIISDISESSSFFIKINIDGKYCNMSNNMMSAIDDMDTKMRAEFPSHLYPTVSLVSPGTRVWCRFAHDDILCRNRKSIGAPVGKKVYCLDGSLLLRAED